MLSSRAVGWYKVNCCTREFGDWSIAIQGSFYDEFDELIPIPGPTKGIGGLPIVFSGFWLEIHSGDK